MLKLCGQKCILDEEYTSVPKWEKIEKKSQLRGAKNMENLGNLNMNYSKFSNIVPHLGYEHSFSGFAKLQRKGACTVFFFSKLVREGFYR